MKSIGFGDHSYTITTSYIGTRFQLAYEILFGLYESHGQAHMCCAGTCEGKIAF